MDEIRRCDRCGGVLKTARVPKDFGFVARCTCVRGRVRPPALTHAEPGMGVAPEAPAALDAEVREILGRGAV